VEEEAPGVRNKWPLVAAVALAVIVAVIYNVHIRRVRLSARGQTVKVLRIVSDMDPGDEITRKDVIVQEVSTQLKAGLGKVVTIKNESELRAVLGYRLNRPAKRDEFLRWTHITENQADSPSQRIPIGMVGVTLDIEPRKGPGENLRVGDRINILGKISVNNGPVRFYRIIEGVKVLEVGGRGAGEKSYTGRPGRSVSEGVRSYRSIEIEVDPDVSLQLKNVLSHVQGSIHIERRNPREKLSPGPPQINPELRGLAAAAG